MKLSKSSDKSIRLPKIPKLPDPEELSASKLKKTLKKAEKGKSIQSIIKPEMLVPSGSVPLNLECSSKWQGAWLLGTIVNLIGDSHAGKTIVALTCMAECTAQKRFDGFDLVYDQVEKVKSFDIAHLFGKKTNKRIITLKKGERSRTIEDFELNIDKRLEGNKPFIYVLDSFDALSTNAELKLKKKNIKKREKGNEEDGSYGNKAKIASEFFRVYSQQIEDHGSFILILSQTRMNIGFGTQFKPRTRSGGDALKFYSFHEMWLAVKKNYKKGKRIFNTDIRARITKNKITGRNSESEFNILFDYGVDNISSCINFLLEEKFWTGSAGSINTKGFMPTKKGNKGVKMENLISFIEKNEKYVELFELCQQAYDNAYEQLKPKNRKRKYE